MTKTQRTEILHRAKIARLAASLLVEALREVYSSDNPLVVEAHRVDDATGDFADTLEETMAEDQKNGKD